MKKTQGAVQAAVLLYVAGGLLLTQLVPNWRVSRLFEKGPQTAQLGKAQEELAKVKQEAAEAEKRYQEALAAQRQATTDQLRFSQQFAAGIPPLLEKAPQTPEVVLARSFAGRVNAGLRSAIGELPADKQEQIMTIIEEALSEKQAEVEAAKAKIAVLDAQLAATTQAKVTLEGQIPAILRAKEAAEAKVEAQTLTVAQKTAQVVKYAERAAEKEKEAGSLDAMLNKALVALGLSALVYMLVHFILPSLAQEFPGAGWLVTANKAVKSVASAHL